MQPSIRPMSIWEILDGSVRLYRAHFWGIVGAALLVRLAGYVVNECCMLGVMAYLEGVSLHDPTLTQLVLAVAFAFLLSAVSLTVLLIQWGVLACVVSDAYTDNDVSLGRSLSRLPVRSLLLSSLLATVVISVGLVLMVVPGLALMLILVMVPIASTVERKGPVAALRRSWHLVRARMPKGFLNNNMMRIGIIWVFAGILGLVGIAVTLALAQAAPQSWTMHETFSTPSMQWELTVRTLRPAARVGMNVVAESVQAFFLPFGICALVLLYYDIRVRKEGLDIERLLRRADSRAAAVPQSDTGV